MALLVTGLMAHRLRRNNGCLYYETNLTVNLDDIWFYSLVQSPLGDGLSGLGVDNLNSLINLMVDCI